MTHLLFPMILVVISSWPVWGWAEQVIGPLPASPGTHPGNVGKCFESVDGPPGKWMTSREVPCRAMDLPPCEQQMREAMTRMDAMHQITLGEWALNKELQKKAGRAGMELWEKTMKDCVVGGK